ncbi:VWA domain-containing protein [Undibacterium amnicola]|uniref:VWA domain-containing protein n=1 Tax=Undibacterium amnicola TaxID=1834038 RepID=A0ABR6XQA0_9BURK|nr:VWA domain-containing protein [Undibacterium amnicola]MBC3831657.1 VWA domain-containing protein [Undibacterium amnicola]
MEEYIGGLWDRLITRVAYQGYPEARVELAQMKNIAATFFRALGGDPGINLQSGSASTHGARRRWLERIAGIGEKTELTWADETTLHLPAYIDYFPESELNRELYLWLLALVAHDVNPDAPYLQRNQSATLALLNAFPSLQERYARLVQATLARRPDPTTLKKQEAENELRIRQALLEPGSVPNELKKVGRKEFSVVPVALWLHPRANANNKSSKPASKLTPEQAQGSAAQSDTEQRKRMAERTDMPDNPSPFMLLFRAESLFSWAEYVKVNRPLDEDDNPDAQRAANDFDVLSVANDGKSTASRVRFDLDLPAEADDDLLLADGILYPEWHYKKQQLLENHACIQMLLARDAVAQVLPVHLRATAKRLRQQFQSLTPERQRLRGQLSGDDIDIDACVRFSAERAGANNHGLAVASPGLYLDNRQQSRDLACLLLADLSVSTDTWVNNQARVIDVIRDSLYLLCEALAATRDRFALYGFSSVRRDNVRFHILKGFDEQYSDQIRGRLAEIKPGFYTRMGAAIRHASAILQQQKNARRLLLILTDGKPNDLDQYEGRYGIEDTRVAVHAARQLGLIPFCVTIDEKAEDYLPHLFGAKGYIVVKDAAELPQLLPRLYAQLTQQS